MGSCFPYFIIFECYLVDLSHGSHILPDLLLLQVPDEHLHPASPVLGLQVKEGLEQDLGRQALDDQQDLLVRIVLEDGVFDLVKCTAIDLMNLK